ncbi:MAG: ABC transporter [Bacteroidetes bacterium GWF2_38_335]|nr:MAG: ABC transporter [Bacteroidetes bacterium GWF2_38_335]OFY82025.1 MAG: ABC transporter [Bacteroidetes bacterium RIFOXYA12_FULL_38_20]HBS86505.1 ABC transporter [Bacteroidales bacterium]
MIYLKLLKESVLFAYNSLVVNKLRTFLSLLGITIGIFAIITVFAVIDSLEQNVHNSISSLGDDVIYVQKWPWEFGPDYPWWKYINRPVPKINEMDEIKKRSKNAEAVAFMVQTNKTIQYRNLAMEETTILAVSSGYEKIRAFDMGKGRYFSDFECNSGKNRCVIGNTIAEELFGNIDPIGKEIKMMGHKLMIVGVFKKEGSSIFNQSMDELVIVPINFVRNLLDLRNDRLNPMIMVKVKPGVSIDQLNDELHGIMRAIRKLKPKADDNFALNKASLITKGFDQIFVIIDLAGLFIGGLSILVGAFGIANIMFVSVKERTKMIGIQKALGAKNFFILYQFLFESVTLSLIGGIIGLVLIYFGINMAARMTEMDFYLSTSNIITGLLISFFTGIFAGIFPALAASRLNPVQAINSNS